MPGTVSDILREISNLILTVTPPSNSSHSHFMDETQNGQVLCPKPGSFSVTQLGNFDLAIKTRTPQIAPVTPSVTQGSWTNKPCRWGMECKWQEIRTQEAMNTK